MEARKKPKKPPDLREKSREWEERFQVLTELTSEWYWEQDESCRFTLVTGGTVGHGIDTKNGIVRDTATIDAQTLPKVAMPAHATFVPDNRNGGPTVK